MENYDFSIVDSSKQFNDEIEALLNQSNASSGIDWSPKPIIVVMRDANGKVVGGLSGSTNLDWLHIRLLAVDKSVNGKGFGTKLMQLAETEALARGCRHAHLDTFSFQALPFYQKLGYEIFGTLDDFPPGHKRYYLRKILSPSN